MLLMNINLCVIMPVIQYFGPIVPDMEAVKSEKHKS